MLWTDVKVECLIELYKNWRWKLAQILLQLAPETRTGIQRRFRALNSSASFRKCVMGITELGQRRGRVGIYSNGNGDENNLCGNGWGWGRSGTVTDGDRNKIMFFPVQLSSAFFYWTRFILPQCTVRQYHSDLSDQSALEIRVKIRVRLKVALF